MARVWRGLFVAVAILAAVSLVFQWVLHTHTPTTQLVTLVRVFDLDSECNIPTWFSSGLLLGAALILFMIASRQRAAGRPFVRHWNVLGAFFVLVSMDETAHIHDGLARHIIPTSIFGMPAHNWVLLAIPFVVALFAAYLPLLRHLPARTRWGMILSGAVYVFGAVGMEMVGFRFEGPPGDVQPPAYVVVATIEESLEMIGVILFARTAWQYAESS